MGDNGSNGDEPMTGLLCVTLSDFVFKPLSTVRSL